jgi:hypothetical protein
MAAFARDEMASCTSALAHSSKGESKRERRAATYIEQLDVVLGGCLIQTHSQLCNAEGIAVSLGCEGIADIVDSNGSFETIFLDQLDDW